MNREHKRCQKLPGTRAPHEIGGNIARKEHRKALVLKCDWGIKTASKFANPAIDFKKH